MITPNNIELELRAEVTLRKFEVLLKNLQSTSKFISKNRRLSVMFLGNINNLNFDIRIRIDNHRKAELVLKKGNFHAHNRTEISQPITKSQFVGLAKILSQFEFSSKVTERENYIFDLGDNITIVLVKSGSIAYIEIEKMSNSQNIDQNKKHLLHLISKLKLKLINGQAEFENLCNRLTKLSDWPFSGSEQDIKKLSAMLSEY